MMKKELWIKVSQREEVDVVCDGEERRSADAKDVKFPRTKIFGAVG